MNDKKITKVEVVEGAIISKGMTHSGRPGFFIPVKYTVEGGAVHTSSVSAERKKDVLVRVERERQNAAAGAMTASYGPDGSFWGTVLRFSIGGDRRSLVPDPIAQPA